MLGGAAHDQQIARVQHEPLGLAAAERTHEERSGPAQADDRDQWVDLGTTDAVGVPCHPVGAVAVVVAEQAGEGAVVAFGERCPDGLDRRR